MSQQHAQFEEEFHEEPQSSSYQAGYRNSPSDPFSPEMQPFQSDGSMPGQKLLDYEPQANKPDILGVRLVLMIVSMSLIFVLFIIAMTHPLSFASIFFTLLFTAIMVVLNLIFNRSLRR